MAEYDVYNEATGHFVCGPIEGKRAAQVEADRHTELTQSPHILREVGVEVVAETESVDEPMEAE